MELLGPIVGGLIQSDSSRSSTNSQIDAQRDAANRDDARYAQIRQDNMPLLNTRDAALRRINALLGLGNGSLESRDQIRARLLPQFTKQVTPQDTNPLSRLGLRDGYIPMGDGNDGSVGNLSALAARTAPSQSTIDEAGLNAAIEAEYAKQNQGGSDINAAIESMPGYKFGHDQGFKTLNSRLAGSGGYFSGNALKAAQNFGQDYAKSKYMDYLNPLMSAAGLGQVGASENNKYGYQNAVNTGNYLSNIGDARASGYIGQNNALMSGLDGLYGAYKKWNSSPPATASNSDSSGWF